jgi:hypothetical protein
VTDVARSILAELAQAALLWAAGTVELWRPVALVGLAVFVVGLVRLAYELATAP